MWKWQVDISKFYILPSSLRPVMELVSGVGWCEASLVGRPEPSIDVLRSEIGPVTSIKVTETAGSPDVFDSCKMCIDNIYNIHLGNNN